MRFQRVNGNSHHLALVNVERAQVRCIHGWLAAYIAKKKNTPPTVKAQNVILFVGSASQLKNCMLLIRVT